ncbi:MAG: phosphotransferase [Pseudomonadota bacterium]
MLLEANDRATQRIVAEFAREITGEVSPPIVEALKGGRTSSVFAVRSEGRSGAFVVKISRHKDATPLFDNKPTDEWSVLTTLSPLGSAPTPVALHQSKDDIWLLAYQYVPGTEGANSADALATLLRTVHTKAGDISLPVRAVAPAHLMSEAESIAADYLPDWAIGLRPPVQDVSPLQDVRLVHRDPIASNIVTDSRGSPVLIDWQCPALGDPLEDIAHATSPAMAHVYGSAAPFDAADVLASYGDSELSERAQQMLPLYRWRMLCYCAWQAAHGHELYAEGMLKEADALKKLRA